MKRIRGVFMRGGTSKGVYFHAGDLPADPALRDRVILDVYGSPDVTEIDGLGGANVLTSKTAVIGPSDRPDADVDYTFGQVMFTEPLVDYRINCGNISAGVGPFAIDEGLVRPVSPMTKVRIFNTNTGKVITAEVPVKNGKAQVAGEYAIDGVPGTGAKILLDFAKTGGTLGRGLLPTGKAAEELEVEGCGTFSVSIVDAANPAVFVRAADVGLTGREPFASVLQDARTGNLADKIRGTAGVRLGLYKDLPTFLQTNPTMPFCVFVAPPVPYPNFQTGLEVAPQTYDVKGVIRFAGAYHRTYSGTGAVCTAVASRLPGTVVHDVLTEATLASDTLRIGHPCGVMEVEVAVGKTGDGYVVRRAAYGRTARRIMEGYIALKPWADSVDCL